jgi:large subunit ribosomal protein L5
MPRLLKKYRSEIASELQSSLSLGNPMEIPALQKVVVTIGTGSPTADKKRLPDAIQDMTSITGQKPQIRRARKAVSNFKTRKGYEIGCRVTLRGKRMYEFVDRLFNAAIPRLRDFRGLNPRSFDGTGNYSMGVADQTIFAEIDVARVSTNKGMNITFVTSAKNDAHGRALLERLGLPLRKIEGQED